MNYQAEDIKSFIIKKLPEHSSDIVAVTAEHFQVSRTTVHRHLDTLLRQHRIIKSGTTRNVKYFLSSTCQLEFTYKITPKLQEYDVLNKDFDVVFKLFKENIYDACVYGFTEIFNNAIDHSKGSKIIAKIDYKNGDLFISITDNGIGVFKNIKEFFHLDHIRESVLQLNKGKMTTDPVHHSGEGIFFCARLFDIFEIYSNNLHYIRDNIQNDWSIEASSTKNIGTKVIMRVNVNAKSDLSELFKKYQSPESLAFSRTDIVVALSKFQQEILMSRSQAKRIIRGLEKFTHITLDFKDVRLVGQGFVDEIFRVFINKHPHIEITYINANDDVVFMIERGLASK